MDSNYMVLPGNRTSKRPVTGLLPPELLRLPGTRCVVSPRVMGPFIVMVGKVVGDVMRFLFLYVEIFIPYACAFWIVFGGTAER